MTDIHRSTTLAVRTDPLEAPTPQIVVPWAEALAFLQRLKALAEQGTAFHRVETPSQVACVVAEAPRAPVQAARPRRVAAKA